jgi:hypothetical protein
MGNYFAPPGTPAEALGIDPTGRVQKTYAPTSDVTALKSTAADTTGADVPANAQGAGGGTQYFVPNSSKSAFAPVDGS